MFDNKRARPLLHKKTYALLAGFLMMSSAISAQAAPQQAKKADDFVDSVGVVLHVQNYNDTDWATVKAQMGAMGVRYFRDGLEHVDEPANLARLQDLYNSYGMKMLAVCGPYGNDTLKPVNGSLSNIASKVAAIKPMLLAVEGPNEPDVINQQTGQDLTWYTPWNYGGYTDKWNQVVWYQNTLYDAIKNDARTSDVQVATFATAYPGTTSNLVGKTIKHDILAWHHYNGNHTPNPQLVSTVRPNYNSSAPAYLTEHGYRVTGKGINDGSVLEKGQMKYNTRSMAYFFNSSDVNGNVKTFFYVTGVDSADGEDYGLDRSDKTPRPSYTAMKNVLNYLKEATWNASSKTWSYPSFTPGALDYSITGDTGAYGFRLVQKSNGDFYLMALPYMDVSNNGDGSDITNSTHNATLTFPANRKVAQYKCDDSGNYTETTLTNGATSVPVTLNDTLMIFKISAPGRATPTPTPGAGANLVTNPGFEADNASTQTPSGWGEAYGNTAASFTEGYGGAHGGSYHGTHYATSAYTIYTYQTKNGLANGLYTLKAWVRSSGGQGTCILEAKDFGGSSLNANLPTTSTWTQLTIPNINVTNGQCTFGIWSNANAGNWCHFDDFEFYKQSGGTTSAIPIGQRIAFKANINNLYVSSNQSNGGLLQASAGSPGTGEKFDVVDAGGGLIALKAVINGLYVSSDQNNTGKLKAAWANSIGTWETFSWTDLGNNSFALKANINGKYVSSDQGDSSTLKAAWNNPIGSWETFNWIGGQ